MCEVGNGGAVEHKAAGQCARAFHLPDAVQAPAAHGGLVRRVVRQCAAVVTKNTEIRPSNCGVGDAQERTRQRIVLTQPGAAEVGAGCNQVGARNRGIGPHQTVDQRAIVAVGRRVACRRSGHLVETVVRDEAGLRPGEFLVHLIADVICGTGDVPHAHLIHLAGEKAGRVVAPQSDGVTVGLKAKC